MHSSLILTTLLAALARAQSNTVPVTGILGDAAVITNNPAGAVYTATLPVNNASTVRGSVVAKSVAGGTGVHYDVSLSGLPSSGGPFLYHLHAFPVPADGNCTGTLAHLDPYQRGETPICNASAPATCQVGDLSGKFGLIPVNSSSFSASFTDLYSSLQPGTGAFFGNRSVVIHYNNKTRITCANFTMSAGSSPAPAPYGNATSAAPSSSSTKPAATMATTSAPSMYTGAAATLGGVGVLAGLAGAVAVLV